MADESTTLDSILSEGTISAPPQEPAPAAAPAAPAPQEPAAPAAPERQRGPDGKFVAAAPPPEPPPQEPAAPAAPPPEPPKEQFTEKEKAFLRALQEERDKRQELERRLNSQQPPAPPQEPKKFWDDPDGAIETLQKDMQQRLQNVQMQTVLNTTEAIARDRHPDFQEKFDTFQEMVKTTPGLAQQWLASSNPAEFLYKTAKSHTELQKAGDLDALRANMEKELRIKIEGEIRAKAEKDAAERAAIPGTLSDARSVGSNNAPVWGGPTPLDSILKP